MVSVYSDADYLSVYKQKRRIFGVFMAATVAYLLFCIGWLIYHISLPYNDPMQALPKACVYVVTAVYVALIFPFMSIKYGRVRKYFKMLTYVSVGLKNEEKNYFYGFEEQNLQKDNIDVVSCIFETWSKKKQEWMDREAYFDPEKPLPPFESGDLVRYIVQSNFIIQYEIVEKKVLEFEEYDENEETDEEFEDCGDPRAIEDEQQDENEEQNTAENE